jgi:hypothetical protein
MSALHQRRQRNDHRSHSALQYATRSICEKLEDRQLLSHETRLIGITGNDPSGNPDPVNFTSETLWDIVVGPSGSDEPMFLDGFEDVASNPPDLTLSAVNNIGVTHGGGALRVDAPQDPNLYWGIRSPNLVEGLKAGYTTLSYDMTLNNIELNGGSYGGGADNSFNGWAQSRALSVAVNTTANGWIERDFDTAATDSMSLGGAWNGIDGTRTITWDLTQFTSNGMSLADFIFANSATEARIWIVTQGADTNGHVGPMRFYFDNFVLSGGPPNFPLRFGDFELLKVNRLITLPFVPDTDAIGFNPEDGLLYRTSGAESWSNNPSSNGYRDNQFMQTVNMDTLAQVGIFNSNYAGNQNGTFGIDAPRPTWLLPVEPRTDQQNTDAYKIRGPNEYHSLRDLTWSTADHAFFGADETGIYKLTPTGESTFIGRPIGISGNPKGIAFHTFEGQRRLLMTERDGPMLWQIDPATGETINAVMLIDKNNIPIPGILSIVEDPTSTSLLGIGRAVLDQENAFKRELLRIDPITGRTTLIGLFPMHMSDLAFIVAKPDIFSKEFVYQTGPQRVKFEFNQNVQASLSAADLNVERLGPGGGPVVTADPIYDEATNSVTFAFNGILPDGNYRATLGGSGVTNTLAMSLAGDIVLDFFVLNGDLNRDRQVSISDFIDLAANFGSTSAIWTQGDLNYDGQVTISDFIDFASNYGATLPPPPAGLAAAPAEISIVSTDSSNASVLDDDDDRVAIKQNRAAKASKSTSRRQSHHRRAAQKSAVKWKVRAGLY